MTIGRNRPVEAAVMYKSILVSIDNSDRAFNALSHAAALAASCGARLFTLYIVKPIECPPLPEQDAPDDGRTEEEIACLREKLRLKLPDAFAKTELVVRRGKNIGQVIVAAAVELDCELIVLGSRRLAGARSVIGRSVTNAVVSSCQKPVLIV
jgi:nucleotide-binding universal stress UspA family protein